jgi:hypothetical protein
MDVFDPKEKFYLKKRKTVENTKSTPAPQQ